MTKPRERRILQDINRQLNMAAPLIDPIPDNFREPKGVERWTGNLDGQPATRTIIYLRSDVGCEFGVKTGGCLACRHFRLGTAGTRVDLPNMYVQQYNHAIQEFGYTPIVCIYNEGNMLNDWELPTQQLIEIVSDLANNGVKRLVLESRPEHICPAILELMAEAAGEMEIEVGIGLESVTDFVRNELFLKAMTLSSFERSVHDLKNAGMKSLAYVIVKPAFLNEAQAIRDAIATVKYAFSIGTDAVSLEPQGVEPHTVSALLESSGAFVPAWLWTVLKITAATFRLGETRIGGFQFEPLPETLPKNCDNCSGDVLSAIDEYNRTYDYSVFDGISCEFCTVKYEQELSELHDEIDENVLASKLRKFVSDHLQQTPTNIVPISGVNESLGTILPN